MSEQAYNNQMTTDPQYRTNFGRLLGAKYLIAGTVTGAGLKPNGANVESGIIGAKGGGTKYTVEVQVALKITDVETGNELEIDNKYIMSPKDLKTIRFIDKMMAAGVRVFKIEGRARGPEYVDAVVRCYKEAIREALILFPEGSEKATEAALCDEWDKRLAAVFNRGFWAGYYQGKTLGEWNDSYGSKATEKKVYAAKTIKYFSKIGVAEFQVEAHDINVGDKLLITGPTTGALYINKVEEIRFDLKPVQTALKGQRISIAVPDKVRPNDKLFVIQNA